MWDFFFGYSYSITWFVLQAIFWYPCNVTSHVLYPNYFFTDTIVISAIFVMCDGQQPYWKRYNVTVRAPGVRFDEHVALVRASRPWKPTIVRIAPSSWSCLRSYMWNKNKLFLKGPWDWIWILLFLRGRSFWIIICKRPAPLDKHLQEVVLPDDHLQEAGPSGWSFARGRSILMIICKMLPINCAPKC